jgi:hypothetical protein
LSECEKKRRREKRKERFSEKRDELLSGNEYE